MVILLSPSLTTEIGNMNERIRELALQAGYQADMFGIGHWDQPECRKFAELIIEECCAQIHDRGQYSNGDWAKYRIRKHFGL
jgi:hypothetical protein